MPSVLFVGHKQILDPDKTLQNAAFDQDLHYLLTENSIKILIKMKNTTQYSLQ